MIEAGKSRVQSNTWLCSAEKLVSYSDGSIGDLMNKFISNDVGAFILLWCVCMSMSWSTIFSACNETTLIEELLHHRGFSALRELDTLDCEAVVSSFNEDIVYGDTFRGCSIQFWDFFNNFWQWISSDTYKFSTEDDFRNDFYNLPKMAIQESLRAYVSPLARTLNDGKRVAKVGIPPMTTCKGDHKLKL